MQNRPPPFHLASQASSECICLPVARYHMPAMRPPLCAWTVHAEPMDPLFSLRFNTPITHRLLRDLSSQLRVSFFPSPLIHAFLRKCTRVHRRSCSAQVKLLTLSLLARCSCDLFSPLYIVQPLLFRLAFFSSSFAFMVLVKCMRPRENRRYAALAFLWGRSCGSPAARVARASMVCWLFRVRMHWNISEIDR